MLRDCLRECQCSHPADQGLSLLTLGLGIDLSYTQILQAALQTVSFGGRTRPPRWACPWASSTQNKLSSEPIRVTVRGDGHGLPRSRGEEFRLAVDEQDQMVHIVREALNQDIDSLAGIQAVPLPLVLTPPVLKAE